MFEACVHKQQDSILCAIPPSFTRAIPYAMLNRFWGLQAKRQFRVRMGKAIQFHPMQFWLKSRAKILGCGSKNSF